MEKNSEIVKKAQVPNDIRALIRSDAYKKQFAMVLPKHLTPERFIRVAMTAITKTPKLAQCSQASMISCLLDLSQLGLEPDGRKAHLIPFGDKCTLIVDYKGLVELARRSGEIADIHAEVVGENDAFEYSYGSDARLIHNPSTKARGKIIAAYSFVKLKDGTSSWQVMTVDEINAIRERSRAKNNGPWVTDWNEMAKKTVFRRHSKWLPLSAEFQIATEKDHDVPFDIVAPSDPIVGKPEVEAPRELPPLPPHVTTPSANPYKDMLDSFQEAKTMIGDDAYYTILKKHGFDKSNKIKDIAMGNIILTEMRSSVA